MIVEVRRIGVFVELIEFPIRGLVKLDDFPEGDFLFDGLAMRFYSRRPRYNYQTGTRVLVAPVRVDRARRFVDFRMVVP